MKYFIFVLASLTCSSAFADDIRLGQPIYGGNGCPQGTASAVLSPDQKTLSILFDQYSVEAGRTTGRNVDRKSCNIAIPVHVPNGLSISLFTVDYRGYNSLPAGAYSQLNADYFFAGQRGPSFSKRFWGNLNENYLASSAIPATAIAWSACGADTNLRINSSLMAQTNSANQQTMSTVDSADIKSGLIYHIQWRTCP